MFHYLAYNRFYERRFLHLSLTYTENRKGDNTPSCLTPHIKYKHLYNALFQRTNTAHLSYQLISSFRRTTGTLQFSNLINIQ